MSTKEIASAGVRGVHAAVRQYGRLSGDASLRRTPESFIRDNIAKAIRKVTRRVTIEAPVYATLQHAGAELRGAPPRNRMGRIDIVAWWENRAPRALVEVKKLYQRNALAADVRRLRQLVGRGGATRTGLIVAYTSAKSPATVAKRFEQAAAQHGIALIEASSPVSYEAADGVRYYGAACFRIG